MTDKTRPPKGNKKPPIRTSMLPVNILEKAEQKVPSTKYLWLILAIVATLAVIKGFHIGMRYALVGTVTMFFLMTIAVLFSRYVKSGSHVSHGPIKVWLWCSIVLCVAFIVPMYTSMFFDWPVHLRDKIFPESKSAMSQVEQQIQPNPGLHQGAQSTGNSIVAEEGMSTSRTLKRGNTHPSGKEQYRMPADKESNENGTNCDDPEADHYVAGTPTAANDAFVKSFSRRVLDGSNKAPVPHIQVFCGSAGQDRASTDVDGVFSCTLPAHSNSLLVEIADPRYERYHRSLRSTCNEPILLKPLKQ